MAQPFPIIEKVPSCMDKPARVPRAVVWMQGITLAWMLIECAVSLYAANSAHSVALLAFGSDSFVELLSATVALLSFVPGFPLDKNRAGRWAGVLLYLLACVVALTAVAALIRGARPEISRSGIAISVAALIGMPVLAWFKRRLGNTTGNRALAADAVQSATCAFLAAITLASLAIDAAFRIDWIDSAAALVIVPILIVEGRKAMRGESCGCC